MHRAALAWDDRRLVLNAALARTVGRTLGQLAKGSRVRGLCLSGVPRSQVFLDGEGRPLAPALLFRDHRAVDDAAEVARYFPTDNPADKITAFHPIARIDRADRIATGRASHSGSTAACRNASNEDRIGADRCSGARASIGCAPYTAVA